jgi:hypothetical protein
MQLSGRRRDETDAGQSGGLDACRCYLTCAARDKRDLHCDFQKMVSLKERVDVVRMTTRESAKEQNRPDVIKVLIGATYRPSLEIKLCSSFGRTSKTLSSYGSMSYPLTLTRH